MLPRVKNQKWNPQPTSANEFLSDPELTAANQRNRKFRALRRKSLTP
jgi:hypothetical protein